MENKPLKKSLRMATAMGIFLPLAETLRRANQLLDPTKFFNWFDDYILGAILLISVYLVNKKIKNSTSFLIAAWGFVSGALFLSLMGQLEFYITGTSDPGVFSTNFVAAAKLSIWIYILFGLHLAIKSSYYN